MADVPIATLLVPSDEVGCGVSAVVVSVDGSLAVPIAMLSVPLAETLLPIAKALTLLALALGPIAMASAAPSVLAPVPPEFVVCELGFTEKYFVLDAEILFLSSVTLLSIEVVE